MVRLLRGMQLLGEPDLLLLRRAHIERSCRSIEIDRTDAYRWSQRLLFRYFFGIRKGYRRTARDPYAKRFQNRYVRVPFCTRSDPNI